jgi:hypothetical protein
MAAPRDRKHLLVPTPADGERYTPHPRKIPPFAFLRPKDRAAHARSLQDALELAQVQATARRDALGIAVQGVERGLYIEFDSLPDVELQLDSLENRKKGIELRTVQRIQADPDGPTVQRATVFIPPGALKHFVSRFQQYATEVTKKGEPKNKEMVDRIAALRLATLRALWNDEENLYPDEAEVIWWEVWLRRHDGKELERLDEFGKKADLLIGARRLAFDDRIVVLVRGATAQLSGSLDFLNDLAEVRRAKESASFFEEATAEEQAAWIAELKQRTTLPPADAPAVCILDTGVTRGHPLLEDVIAEADATAVDVTWGAHDNGGAPGHGTAMAGLAGFGDLALAFLSGAPVHLRHRLESVKILPPRGGRNDPDNYGAITAQAVARPEVTAPHRFRVFSLAVTAEDQRDKGRPTAWSAAIDAMAAGRTFDQATGSLTYVDKDKDGPRRLFVVSAGNVPPERIERGHLNRSDLEAVHDPAQAWNALTVGGYTDKAVIKDPGHAEWAPIARPGDLSPHSTTSVLFQNIWPIKPDVVAEAGNVAIRGAETDRPLGDLSLLTTNYKPFDRPLVLADGTSAASAQVARIAAIVHAEYPMLWPETVRALIVHSARWTPAMEAHFPEDEAKRAREKLVRRYGFGVPSLDRALRSANDALTLIAQGTTRPFKDGKLGEMQVHVLPWPTKTLEELEDTVVRLRVTLSYFIEPNPGERGWRRRYSYASHGLRFDVKQPTESLAAFRKSLNQLALEAEEEKPSTASDSTAWFLGPQARARGSIHSDVLLDVTARDLAERGVIGIYPVSGWWKHQDKRDRSHLGARYALLVSVETDAEAVDIWTPVAQQIGVPIEQVTVEV